jgi:hypothetical protein
LRAWIKDFREIQRNGQYVAGLAEIGLAPWIGTHTGPRRLTPRATAAIAILAHRCGALFSFGRVAFNRVEGAGRQYHQRKKWQDFGVRHYLGPIMA